MAIVTVVSWCGDYRVRAGAGARNGQDQEWGGRGASLDTILRGVDTTFGAVVKLLQLSTTPFTYIEEPSQSLLPYFGLVTWLGNLRTLVW